MAFGTRDRVTCLPCESGVSLPAASTSRFQIAGTIVSLARPPRGSSVPAGALHGVAINYFHFVAQRPDSCRRARASYGYARDVYFFKSLAR